MHDEPDLVGIGATGCTTGHHGCLELLVGLVFCTLLFGHSEFICSKGFGWHSFFTFLDGSRAWVLGVLGWHNFRYSISLFLLLQGFQP